MELIIKKGGYCPRCLRTASWDDDELMTCDWCNQTFIYYQEWDEFRDDDDIIIERKASIFLDKLIEISRARYNTDVVHLNREQQKKIGFEKGQRGGFVTKKNGQSLILIDGSADEMDRIIILSHEMGHAANFQNDYKRDHETWLNHMNLNYFNGAHSVMH